MNAQQHYHEQYKEHFILSEDILNEEKESEFFKEIRKRIKDARKKLKMTQREFGENSGSTPDTPEGYH